jgi:hypothetical protein
MDPRTSMSCNGCKEEGNTYTWSSDKDGLIGHGTLLMRRLNTTGRHIITLNVKNVNGTENSDSVNIDVTYYCQ